MQRHLNVNPEDGKQRRNNGRGPVWSILKQKNKRNGKGRETNVRAAVHEIKKILPK